ncbi:3,4-dihydroxy-2-butanone-4-phosphate synthase [Bacillus sp. SL00103]
MTTTTGISALSASTTMLRHAGPGDATPEEFFLPRSCISAHCKEGGVLERPGHTEAKPGRSCETGRFTAGGCHM